MASPSMKGAQLGIAFGILDDGGNEHILIGMKVIER